MIQFTYHICVPNKQLCIIRVVPSVSLFFTNRNRFPRHQGTQTVISRHTILPQFLSILQKFSTMTTTSDLPSLQVGDSRPFLQFLNSLPPPSAITEIRMKVNRDREGECTGALVTVCESSTIHVLPVSREVLDDIAQGIDQFLEQR